MVTYNTLAVNDKTLRLMFESTIASYPPISDRSRTLQAEKMVASRRLRCWGHILNIVATSFVFTEENKVRAIGITSIRKAHKINHYVRWTAQRRDAFRREVRYEESLKTQRDCRIAASQLDDYLGDTEEPNEEDYNPILEAAIYDSEAALEEDVDSGCPPKIHNDTRWNGVLEEVRSSLHFQDSINRFYYTQSCLDNSDAHHLEVFFSQPHQPLTSR